MSHPRELLTAAAIEAMAGVPYIHPLNPNVVRSSKSLGDAAGLTQLGVHLVTVMPGRESTEYHFHHCEEEFVYVLSGCGQALLDERIYPITAGDFLGFPKHGVAHALTNNGSEPLLLLVGGQRLADDVCDYPRSKKRLLIQGGQESMLDLDD